MKQNHLVRFAILAILVAITLVFLAGCPAALTTQFEQWDHVIDAVEFSVSGAYLFYEYDDTRFNNADFFDMHMVEAGGVSDFDSVYDVASPSGFLYQPVYSNGSVTWYAHSGADGLLDGKTLRFYRISK